MGKFAELIGESVGAIINDVENCTKLENSHDTTYVYTYRLDGNQTNSYDPTGRRQSKTVNGVTTTHRWDGSNIVGESIGSANYTYYRGLKLIAQSDGTTTGYYQYNGHGDTMRITNAAGSVLASYDYDAFGNQKNVVENIYNPFRYCGEYADEESGLIYLRARYYEPGAGRFISEDPAKDGLNWYAYCGGNPVNFVDPSGMWMEGDENLSRVEQLYIHYYTRLWENATTQEERDSAHMGAENIRAQAGSGNIEGLFYDVPLYKQGSKPLCMSYSAAMIENTGVEKPMTQEEANIRAEEIDKNGWADGRIFYNSVKYDDVNYESLYTVLMKGPQKVDYNPKIDESGKKTDHSGHTVVLAGVLRCSGQPDLVIIVNPQGESIINTPQNKDVYEKERVFTMNEFLNWYDENDFSFEDAFTHIGVSEKKK